MLRRTHLIDSLAAAQKAELGTAALRAPLGFRRSRVVVASMGDVVVKLPVHPGAEAQLFGSFLSSFIESREQEAELWSADSDAPYVIVRSDPQSDVEMKVVIFQQRRAARDFSRGWARALTDLAAKA